MDYTYRSGMRCVLPWNAPLGTSYLGVFTHVVVPMSTQRLSVQPCTFGWVDAHSREAEETGRLGWQAARHDLTGLGSSTAQSLRSCLAHERLFEGLDLLQIESTIALQSASNIANLKHESRRQLGWGRNAWVGGAGG